MLKSTLQKIINTRLRLHRYKQKYTSFSVSQGGQPVRDTGSSETLWFTVQGTINLVTTYKMEVDLFASLNITGRPHALFLMIETVPLILPKVSKASSTKTKHPLLAHSTS
jgi:hypothetical protein